MFLPDPHSKRSRPGRRRAGFTLLELLVVLAIILVLAAILLAVLSKARESAKAAPCIANHKSLITAWIMYADDHGGYLVPNHDLVPFMRQVTNWVSGNLQEPTGQDQTNTVLLMDRDKSLLASYLQNPRVFKCPSDRSPLVRSVSMNNRMNPVKSPGEPLVLGGHGTNYMVYRTLSDFGDPSRIFVILDERYDSINEGNFAVDMSNTGNLDGVGPQRPYYWIDTPAGYHNRSGVFSFADGHVATRRWLEPTTLGPIGVTGPRHTSPSDRDIQWVQRHCTESKLE